MIIEFYLEYLSKEAVGGFAIDSFPTKVNKRPLSVPYPNENIDEPETEKKRILIDLDGVVHKYSEGFKDGTIYDPPINGAKEAIEKLRNSGYEVFIFTARLSPNSNGKEEVLKQKIMIKDWLKKYGIEVDGITAEKLHAEIYVDDRGLRFNGDWDAAGKEIDLRLGEK